MTRKGIGSDLIPGCIGKITDEIDRVAEDVCQFGALDQPGHSTPGRANKSKPGRREFLFGVLGLVFVIPVGSKQGSFDNSLGDFLGRERYPAEE